MIAFDPAPDLGSPDPPHNKGQVHDSTVPLCGLCDWFVNLPDLRADEGASQYGV